MKLSAQHVSFRVGPHRLLEDISFSAKPGSITGLIGPNGAGKTTLLKLLAGLEKPFSGSLEIDDTDITAMTPQARARLLAYIPQTQVVHWPVSVFSIVSMGRLPFRKSPGKLSRDCLQIVEQAMKQMQVDQLADRDTTSLSGGEQSRVLLARALAQTPHALLADEPTAGLDARHQISLMRKFQSLAASGITVIVVLHDLSQAARFCDHLVLLNHGHIVCQGLALDVLTKTIISDVYGVDVAITRVNDFPVITPLTISIKDEPV